MGERDRERERDTDNMRTKVQLFKVRLADVTCLRSNFPLDLHVVLFLFS